MWLQLLTLGLSGLLSLNQWDNKVPIEKVIGDGDLQLFTGIPYMIYPDSHGGKYAMMRGYIVAFMPLEHQFSLITELDRFSWNLYEPSGEKADLAQFMIIPTSNSCYLLVLLDSTFWGNSDAPFYPSWLVLYSSYTPRMLSWSSKSCIRFQSTKSGSVVTKVDTKYLSATSTTDIKVVDQVTDSTQMKWEQVVAPGKGRIINMKYDEDEETVSGSSVPQTMSKREYINNSTVTQTQTFKATYTKTETHSFAFSTSFKIFSSVSVEAGVPLLGSTTVETGFETEFGTSTDFSTQVTREFSVEEPVVVPPKTKVTAIATLTVAEGVTLPVTVTLRATLDVRRLEEISEGQYQKVSEPASGEFVKAYLLSEKVDGRIISVDGNVVTLETQAEVKATYGIYTFVTVNEEPL